MSLKAPSLQVILRRIGLSDIEVVEATEPFTIQVLAADIIPARGVCAASCVLARAASRKPRVIQAWFWANAAYIHERLPEGRSRLVRYIPEPHTRDEINNFDETTTRGVPTFHTGIYKLRPPSPRETLLAARTRRVTGKRHQPTGTSGITRKPRLSTRPRWGK